MKLHTGDTVLVISGKDRGKTGTVLRVLPEVGRAVVSDVNKRIKFVKKTVQQPGRQISFEASIHVSNLMILDPKTKKPSRIGYTMDAKGKKQRISKVSGEVLTGANVKAAKTGKRKVADAKKKKKTSATSETSATSTAVPPKKQPFWKRMGFGSQAQEEAADVKEGTRMQQDHTIPDQQKHVRAGSRGS